MRDLVKKFVSSEWTGPLALAFIHLLLALLSYQQAPFTGGDDATYISLARSLIERHDYRDIWNPELPLHTQYPPIFPIVVAGGLLAGLSTQEGLKILMIFISTGAVFASCLWLRRVTTPGIAFCAGFFIVISPEIIWLGQEVLSDPLFWLFAMLALIWWRRADRPGSDANAPMSIGLVVTAAAFTLAGYFTRSAGAPLLLAVLIWLLIRKQYRAIGIVTLMSAPLIFLWWLRGHGHGAGGYLAPFIAVDPYNPALGTVTPTILVKRVAENLSVYAQRHLARLVFGSLRTGVIFGVAFAAAVLWGWIKRVRQRPGLAEVWLPIYLALVLLWPVAWAGARFLFPVVPLLALYVGLTIADLAKAASHPRVFSGALLFAGIVTVSPALRRQIRTGSQCRERFYSGERFPCTGKEFADFFETAERARGKLPPHSVVLSRKPTIFYAHSGYQSVLYPLSPVPDSLFNLAKRVGAQYVVVDQISDLAPKYLHPILLARRDDFCVIRELSTEDAAFARIDIGGPPRAPGAAANSFRTCEATK
ncbi:MAG TPA: hypothetical protein VFD22_10525 [Gemmatimonadaceae bacterium]|nr:hypothetical protein [Gemmatimonadaceae bacterium]